MLAPEGSVKQLQISSDASVNVCEIRRGSQPLETDLSLGKGSRNGNSTP